MESLLTNFSETHRILSYLIIFFSIFIEGEILLILAGVLSHKGYLDIFDVIIIASVAAILHDLLYWSIGGKLSERNKKKTLFFIDLEKVKAFLGKLRISNGPYIFISKFAWSLNRVILITSGYMKMPVNELLRYSIPASLVWSITLVSLGNVFAFETDILKKDFKTASLILVIFIVVIIVLENLLRKMLEKRTSNK